MGKRQPTRLEVLVMEPQIVLLYESGMTIKDLIPIVKLGRRSILSVLKKHGIAIKNRAPRKPPLKRAVVTIPLESHKLLSDYAESQGLFLIEAAEVLIRAGFNALNPEIPQNPQNGNAIPSEEEWNTQMESAASSYSNHDEEKTPFMDGFESAIEWMKKVANTPSNDSLRGKNGKIHLRGDKEES